MLCTTCLHCSLYLVLEYADHDLAGLLDLNYRFSTPAIKYIIRQLLEVSV
jgi:serine/threonine protein kinase